MNKNGEYTERSRLIAGGIFQLTGLGLLAWFDWRLAADYMLLKMAELAYRY